MRSAAFMRMPRIARGRQTYWGWVFFLLMLASLLSLAVYLFSSDWLMTARNLPIALHSGLRADYSADLRGMKPLAFSLALVGEAARDQQPGEPDPLPALAILLQTPVATLVPQLTPVAGTATPVLPTSIPPTPQPASPTAQAPSQVSATTTATSTPTGSPTVRATRQTVPPIATQLPPTQTQHAPTRTQPPPTVTQPAATATNPPKPTATPLPSPTPLPPTLPPPTAYPPPATAAPTLDPYP